MRPLKVFHQIKMNSTGLYFSGILKFYYLLALITSNITIKNSKKLMTFDVSKLSCLSFFYMFKPIRIVCLNHVICSKDYTDI